MFIDDLRNSSTIPGISSGRFSPPVAASLYGARLGVGPLTILRTWLWWAAFVLAATLGPGVAAAAGIVFAGVRGLTMVAAGSCVRASMVSRMAGLRRAEPAVRLLSTCVVLLVVVLALW
jgi:hypothetical protein